MSGPAWYYPTPRCFRGDLAGTLHSDRKTHNEECAPIRSKMVPNGEFMSWPSTGPTPRISVFLTTSIGTFVSRARRPREALETSDNFHANYRHATPSSASAHALLRTTLQDTNTTLPWQDEEGVSEVSDFAMHK